ncbi:MAG: putative LL-diaminopimelate aminotransferase [Francisellaceae bacterium]|nr:putative LL-diaminopimelate aminotransferase [Francisellaceae bacterium]
MTFPNIFFIEPITGRRKSLIELNFLRLPDNSLVGDIDKIMALSIHAKYLAAHGKPIVFASMGHPTYGVNLELCKEGTKYWEKIINQEKKIDNLFSFNTSGTSDQENEKKLIVSSKTNSIKAQQIMAEALNKTYYLSNHASYPKEMQIKHKNIIFTIGGANGLHIIFEALNKKNSNGHIITPSPYYTLYPGLENKNKLILMDVMGNIGYRLQAENLKIAFDKAKKKNVRVSALLICDPNNPTGTVINENEWNNFIEILKNEDCYIIIDAAYAEINFLSHQNNFLSYLASKYEDCLKMKDKDEKNNLKKMYDNLLSRTIILHSGTKGMSASGDRMACILAFDEVLVNELINQNKIRGIAPESLQIQYAKAKNSLNDSFYFDYELNFLSRFYEKQVIYMQDRLHEIGLSMPDSTYKVEGGFYVLANCKELIGFEINDVLLLKQLKEIGLKLSYNQLNSDEDIAYYFLYKYHLAITPLSYFGTDSSKGYIRITCSRGTNDLDKIIEILYDALKNSRKASKHLPPHQELLLNNATTILLNINKPRSNEAFKESYNMSPKINFAKLALKYWSMTLEKSLLAENVIDNYLKQNEIEKLLFFKEKMTQAINKIFSLIFEEKDSISEGFFNEHSLKRILNDEFITLYEIFSDKLRKDALINYIWEQGIVWVIDYIRLSKYEYLVNKNKLNFLKDFQCSLLTALTDRDDFFQSKLNKILVASQKKINSLTENKIKLISGLVLEKMLKDNYDGKDDIFSQFIYNFVFQSKKNQNWFSLINDIVNIKAAIDYAHPQGVEDYRSIMALNVSELYKYSIAQENILYVGCNGNNILMHQFSQEVIVLKSFCLDQISKPLPKAVFFPSYEIFAKNKNLDLKQVIEFTKQIDFFFNKYPTIYLIIDESFIDYSINNNYSLFKMLISEPTFKHIKQIIILHSSEGLFTDELNKISMLIVFDKLLMSKLVSLSVNIHGHAPRFLQFSYSHACAQYVNSINTDQTQYINYDKNLLVNYSNKRIEDVSFDLPGSSNLTQNNEKLKIRF